MGARSWIAHEIAAQATGPYVERGARFASRGLSARDAALRARTGYRGLASDVVSSGEWFHGMSDRHAALGQIAADWAALQGDLSLHATSPDNAAWVAAIVAPILADWQLFAQKQAGNALSPFVTEWSVFESWSERLARVRELARSRGIQLDSPEPVPLPKTIWQRSQTGTGSDLDTWVGLAKTVLFGTIAVTGVVGFLSIARDFRRGLKAK